jgi:hypothetical protein
VTFHGYDYARKRAARGVARTRDFVAWEVVGGEGNLSGDVMFSARTASGRRCRGRGRQDALAVAKQASSRVGAGTCIRWWWRVG